jgi:hypothetical protein
MRRQVYSALAFNKVPLAIVGCMTAAQFKPAIGALAVVGATIALVVQHQALSELREQNQSLRQQVAQLQADNASLSRRESVAKLMLRLPAPHVPATAPPPEAPLPGATNLYARFNALMKDGPPKLTATQVEAYLKANGRNAPSLLAAYRTSSDPALLKEAREKYPNDPQVAFESAFDKDLSGQERNQWLNAFKKAAPDNALANYLLALNYFKAGQADQAVEELTAACGKGFYDYTRERMQDDAEAYLTAGYPAVEAEVIASDQLKLPQLYEIKQLGQNLVDLAKAYSQAGDAASAQAALQTAMILGRRYSGDAAATGISQLVGLSVELMALGAMDPNSPYGGTGQTVQDQLDQLDRQRAAYAELAEQMKPLLPIMSEQDGINFRTRQQLFGPQAAMRWLVAKYGQQ